MTDSPTCYGTLEATCHPADGLDADTTATGSASVSIPKPSYWKYEGDIIGINKSLGSSSRDLWPLVYAYNAGKDTDTKFASYTIDSILRGYDFTHNVNGEGADPSKYQGGSYTLMAAEDVVYAWSSKDTNNKILLTDKDYRISSCYIRANIYGYEVSTATVYGGTVGKYTYPDINDYRNRNLVIQAMFSADGENPDAWVDVASLPWENASRYGADGKAYFYVTYQFTNEDLARQPCPWTY